MLVHMASSIIDLTKSDEENGSRQLKRFASSRNQPGRSLFVSQRNPPTSFTSQHASELILAGRKRSWYEIYGAHKLRDSYISSTRNGPFRDSSSSADEAESSTAVKAKRTKGTSRATAFKAYRRNEGEETQTLMKSRPRPIETYVDGRQKLLENVATYTPAESNQIKAGSKDDPYAMRSFTHTQGALPPSDASSKRRIQHTPGTGIIKGPSEADIGRKRPTTSDVANRLVARPLETARGRDPSTALETERRLVKARPLTKQQQWLKQNSKVLSHSAKHAGKIPTSVDVPRVEAPIFVPKAKSPQLPQATSPQPKSSNDVQRSKNPDQAIRDGQDQSSTTPLADVRTSQLAVVIGSKAALFNESSVPENDRCLIDWKDNGLSWEEISAQWQKKTGAKAAQGTLEKRYRQAKKSVDLELHGMKMAQQNREQPKSSTVDQPHSPLKLTDDREPCQNSEPPQDKGRSTGGKTFSNEMWAAKMAELREAREEEERLEEELDNGFFRDQSPQPDEHGHPMFYLYQVIRKTWLKPDMRNDALWYTIRDVKNNFTSLLEANQAAMVETTKRRLDVGLHMRFVSYTGRYQDDMYSFIFEGQDGSGFEVKVERELVMPKQDEAGAESKVGWFKKRVFIVFKRTEVTTKPDVPANNEVALFEEPLAATVEVHESQVGQVYTIADQANRVAADVLLDLATPRSARLDNIDERSKYQKQLEEMNDMNQPDGILFEVEFEREETLLRGKVWVEQRYLEGPRNI